VCESDLGVGLGLVQILEVYTARSFPAGNEDVPAVGIGETCPHCF
jgi:hypothetical protein